MVVKVTFSKGVNPRFWPKTWLLYKTKEEGLILQSQVYMYFFTNISLGTAILLKGPTYNEEITLRRYNLK